MRIAILVPIVVLWLAVETSGAATPRSFKNCKALNAVYPHGVGKPGARDRTSSGDPVRTFKRNRALYEANKRRDRDGDGVACERD